VTPRTYSLVVRQTGNGTLSFRDLEDALAHALRRVGLALIHCQPWCVGPETRETPSRPRGREGSGAAVPTAPPLAPPADARAGECGRDTAGVSRAGADRE
jgi:hypothetical protein